LPHGSGFPATRKDARTRRPAINPRTVALSFVVGGTLTISGSLLATGIIGGKDSAPDAPITASNLTGNAGTSADGRLNPPPAAPLDRTDADDATSPSAAALLASPTPTATKEDGSSGAGADNAAAPTATNPPATAASNGAGDPKPTATNQPANNTAAAAATNPPATATNPPATAVPSATTAPTQAPTQPPVPTATQVPPTQPPSPTATTPPPTATATTPPPPPQSTSLHSMESAMFASHNQQRAANGVAALAIDAQLVQVARQRSQTMADTNCFSHTTCGPTAFSLLGNIGYTYQIAGENIARNNYSDADTVQVAMTGFMNSTGHRNNILDSRYTKVGIGVAFGANGMKYFTVIFAGP
jgi:uncharacterized protein YkwD